MATETFKNAGSVNVPVDSFTTVYTVPASTTTIVVGSHLSNKTSVDVSVTVDWYDSSAAAFVNIGTEMTVPNNAALDVISGRLVLETGDYIRVSQIGGSANSVDATFSLLEIV